MLSRRGLGIVGEGGGSGWWRSGWVSSGRRRGCDDDSKTLMSGTILDEITYQSQGFDQNTVP